MSLGLFIFLCKIGAAVVGGLIGCAIGHIVTEIIEKE